MAGATTRTTVAASATILRVDIGVDNMDVYISKKVVASHTPLILGQEGPKRLPLNDEMRSFTYAVLFSTKENMRCGFLYLIVVPRSILFKLNNQ